MYIIYHVRILFRNWMSLKNDNSCFKAYNVTKLTFSFFFLELFLFFMSCLDIDSLPWVVNIELSFVPSNFFNLTSVFAKSTSSWPSHHFWTERGLSFVVSSYTSWSCPLYFAFWTRIQKYIFFSILVQLWSQNG